MTNVSRGTSASGLGEDVARQIDAIVARAQTANLPPAPTVEPLPIGIIDSYVPRVLWRWGLSPRERTAREDRVPTALRNALAKVPDEIEELLTTRRGFGLSGGAGAGKTFALVTIFQRAIATRLRRDATLGFATVERLSELGRWVPWPDKVNLMRVTSVEEGGTSIVQGWVVDWINRPVLVIDDLGAERAKGSYSDDWAASLLDLVVDARYRALRPTWYTTNLSTQEFHGRYGARLFSRLCGENRLIELPRMPDLRMGAAR